MTKSILAMCVSNVFSQSECKFYCLGSYRTAPVGVCVTMSANLKGGRAQRQREEDDNVCFVENKPEGGIVTGTQLDTKIAVRDTNSDMNGMTQPYAYIRY